LEFSPMTSLLKSGLGLSCLVQSVQNIISRVFLEEKTKRNKII